MPGAARPGGSAAARTPQARRLISRIPPPGPSPGVAAEATGLLRPRGNVSRRRIGPSCA